ncbi:MAG TPA: amidohydrolase family protein [Chryseolinea sp.]|nr:amidohydrolase family protein [Chryseolinea sp.]
MKKTYFKYVKRTFALTLMCISTLGFAQDERKLGPVTRSYAITQATIVQGPGRKIEKGTVLIKDGLITAVGQNLTIPADAIQVKGDSLYVYAGFIDGLSRVAVTRPKEDLSKEKVKDPGNPAPERAGITPQNDVRNFLNPADKAVEELRALGFTTAHVVPHGGMLSGSGSVIFLGGSSADEMVVVSRSSLYSELTPAERVYPNTVLGVMAKWRELYRQASLTKSYESTYASNRIGIDRPATDRVLEAFYPVIDKKIPVLFRADKALDLQRVLTLQKDLAFSLIAVNLKEGWDAIPKIKSSGAKVFLSLELPEEKKEEKKDEKAPAESPFTDSLERKALEKRRADFVALHAGQASSFQKAGVAFGFTTLSAKTKDISSNLRRIIRAGLTEDQALAALTTSPASLLGLSDRLGSIDPGKVANLVISRKPYFDEKSKMQYVFVDGVMYRIESKEIEKPAEKKTDKP